jgi:cell division protein FtsQ
VDIKAAEIDGMKFSCRYFLILSSFPSISNGVKFMDKGKVVSIEERIPKLKQQRRRKANKRLTLLLLFFFFLIACIVYVQSPLSHVRTISVKGNLTYSKNEIISETGLSKKENIWKVDEKEVEKDIEKLPEMGQARVKVRFPNAIVIDVKEHERVAYFSEKTSFYPVLENGKILQNTPIYSFPENSPILTGFKEGKVLNELVSSLKGLPEEVRNSISEIHHEPSKTDQYHITLYMNDGFEVSATLRTFSEKMAHYPSIVSQLDPNIKGVIDLEVGSYFKAYGMEGEGAVEENKDEGEG